MITFRQSKWDLDSTIGNNAETLDGINRRLATVLNDTVYRLRHVSVYGGASPEGSVNLNKFLSEQRAATLFRWFDKYNQLSQADKTFIFLGRDWEGVLDVAGKDPALPFRDETLSLLASIAQEKRNSGGKEPARSLERIKQLRGGEPYRYLYRNVFPAVRASKVIISYERIVAPLATQQKDIATTVTRHDTIYVERVVEVRDTVYVDTCNKDKK